MKSLLTKILLALIAGTVLALLLNAILSRTALQRGFEQFLEQQEESQLQGVAPELAEYYRRHGSWEELAGNPRRWMRVLVQTRPEGIRPPDEAPPEFMPRTQTTPPRGALHKPPGGGPPREARRLWRRLFLLDQDKRWVAGARDEGLQGGQLLAIEVEGATVGWLGFQPADAVTAPEARRYLKYQNRALLLSLIIALVLASALGYWLARNLSRPVTRLRDVVQVLTSGDFTARAPEESRDEIGDLARHVNRLAATLEKNETARRRWTADIAHELRTPLAILRAELDAVKDGVRPYTGATLDSVTEEVSHLSQLVEDLQTLALADAGALNIRLQAVDLAGLVRQVQESFTERLAAAGLQLETGFPERLEIQADPQRMRQLLHNLLENTCRYTHRGGTVRISLKTENDRVLLEIEDTAPGVNSEHQARLFDRFYRAEPGRERVSGGSGLGLAICRNIVEAHGGEISATDSPLGGLAIRVHLPRGI